MTNYSHEELKAQGYKSHIKQTFSVEDGLARECQFQYGPAEGTPDFCVRSALAVARGLGLFDLPVIQNDRGNRIEYTFYFKNSLEHNLFELGVTGPKNGTYTQNQTLADDEPTEMCDAYIAASIEFCEDYEISCQLVKAGPRTFSAIFNSNVDHYAFQHGLFDREQKISRMAKFIYESSKPKSGPALG